MLVWISKLIKIILNTYLKWFNKNLLKKELCAKDLKESFESLSIRPHPQFIGIGHTVQDFVFWSSDNWKLKLQGIRTTTPKLLIRREFVSLFATNKDILHFQSLKRTDRLFQPVGIRLMNYGKFMVNDDNRSGELPEWLIEIL